MKRILGIALIALVCALPASAQDWAKKVLEQSPRHGEWIDIKSGDRSIHTFVAYPETKGKAPVVIIIHEIFGMTDWVRTVADQLAANGYIAIAPDLLSGMGPNGGNSESFGGTDGARGGIAKLNPDQITNDLSLVVDYSRKMIKASNGKVSVAGFCWGGTQTFRFATNRQDLAAAFVFYGSGPDDVTKIKAPVYGFYAGNDSRIGATIPATTDAMHKAGKTYDPVTYDGAGHGFMRAGMDPTAPTGTDDQKKMADANKKAREDAWKRWLDLLKKA